jgi:hypothetical protein
VTPIAKVHVRCSRGLTYADGAEFYQADLVAFNSGLAVIVYRSGPSAGRFGSVTLDRLDIADQAPATAPAPAQLAHPAACPEHGPAAMRQSQYPGRPPYCGAPKEGTRSGYCRWQPKEEAAA